MSSIYDAVPLDREISSTNIRVVKGLIRASDGQISCKLQKIDIREKSYRALSYAWGLPDAEKSITIDDKPFEVRKNLWDFLNEACTRGISTPEPSANKERQEFLWIDAICIDQLHVEERNHEVAMMGKIYSHAQDVLVWLGPSTPIIDTLLQNMYGLKIDESSELLWKKIVSNQEKRVTQHGMDELCEKEYWERLWVVREYLLATKVEIWCGRESVDPEKMKLLVNVEFKTARLAESCAMELLQGRTVRSAHADQLSLKRHLHDYGIPMNCTDVRDRVYGLLGLINEKEREKLRIRPNYALSPDELFFKLFTALQRSGLYGPEYLLVT